MRSLTAAGLCLLGLACQPRSQDLPNHSIGSLAFSRDDALVYAVETDSATVAVVDVKSTEKVAEIRVGAGAHLVAVAPDDTLYVANRRDGSLSVVRRGEWSAVERWPAGVEPVGLALSPDATTVYVVSAVAADTSAHGDLLALDARTGAQRWQLALGREPRGITLIDEHAAVVALLKDGDLMWVDLTRREVQRAGTSVYEELKVGTENAAFHPRDVSTVAYDAASRRVYALATLAREGPHGERHRCLEKLVAPPALLAFDPAGRPHVEAVNVCSPLDAPSVLPRTLAFTRQAQLASRWETQGGSGISVARDGSYVWVAYAHGNAVAAAFTKPSSAERNEGWLTQVVGRNPTGIVLGPEDRSVWVHNALDHTLSRIIAAPSGAAGLEVSSPIRVGEEVLGADVVAGRKLFFDATDARLTSPAVGVACATCHVEGGDEDGHVWRFANGRRQTSSLVGGRLSGTAPFHWDGAFETFEALMQHTVERMGGTGLTPALAAQLLAYLESVPARPRPPAAPSAAGATLFARAGCGTCHAGAQLTNNGLARVGTDETGFSALGVNVPSLLGVGRTAPYLHDGSAPTLRVAVERHASTAGLSASEVAELLAYVEQL